MTSINNNENNRTFFAFLRQNDAWETDADTNHDGVLGSLELKQYLADNGFDYSSLEGWNGENATKSTNDLFNKFWNSMNINSSSTKISGTKIKQKAGLDGNEQQAMLNRIEADERVEDFVSALKIPSFVKDETGCKKEIYNKFMELVEKNILNQFKNLDGLDDLLANNVQSVKNAAITQVYASECIKENMDKVAKDYNYKYEDDNTLKNMINNLAKKITAETTESEIQEAIEGIVKGYLATAGLGNGSIPQAGDDEGLTAASVWYNPANGSALNDLQKAVVETKLKKQKETILKGYGSDYEHYKSSYDAAFEEFIADTLKNAKFGDFAATEKFGKTEFEASKIYKNLEKTVKVKNLLRGYELDKSSIKEALENAGKTDEEIESILKKSDSEIEAELRKINLSDGDIEKMLHTSMIAKALSAAGLPQSLIDRVTNAENRPAFKILDTIEDDLITRVLNGEFGQDIGDLDIGKILEDAASQIRKNIMSFYGDGLGKQSLTELKDIYAEMDEVAEEQEDSEQNIEDQRKAAILFCEALASKNDKFKEAVISIFGENYKDAINKLLPSEITKLMNGDKEKGVKGLIEILDDLGDASTFASAGSGLSNEPYTLSTGTTKTFNISPKFKVPKRDAKGNVVKDDKGNIQYEEKTVTTDRITYKTSNDFIKIENGKVTINAGANPGIFTTTVQILVDGVVVRTKEITIKVEATVGREIVNSTGWGNQNSSNFDLRGFVPNGHDSILFSNTLTDVPFETMYNQDWVVTLSLSMDSDRSAEQALVDVGNALTNLGNLCYNSLNATGKFTDANKLREAVNETVAHFKSTVNPWGMGWDDDGRDEYDLANNLAWAMKGNRDGYRNKVHGVSDDDGDDSSVYGLYFKDFVDMVLEKYNAKMRL